MTIFRLRTLGGVSLERDGSALNPVGTQRKTLALLAILAVSRRHGISRDRVAVCLWPDSDTERARGALKQSLHIARRQLGSPDAIPGTSELRLNPAYITSDVEAFLDALERGDLERAVELYGGPFLDGFHLAGTREFEEWASAQRDDLARRYAAALERIATAAEEAGDLDAAIEWLRRMQTCDPLSARTTLRLMRALDAVGERVAALRCAHVHELLLREELDSPPDSAVAALAERLRAEGSHAARAAPPDGPPELAAAAPIGPAQLAAAAAVTSALPEEPARTGAPPQGAARRHAAVSLAAAAGIVLVAAVLWVSGKDGSEIRRSAEGSTALLPVPDRGNDGVLATAPPITADEEAYDLYLRGRHAWKQRTREGIMRSIVLFEGAIDRDPAFAAAYAALAATYVNCSNFGYCDLREGLARADVAADRALSLDSSLAEGHATKGFVHASRQEFDASEAAFRRAIELNHSLTWAHHYYTLLLLMLGRTEEAGVQNREALALDPLSLPANATRGIILLQDGDLVSAERELQRALALSPGFQLTLYYLGVVLAARGRWDDAGQLLEHAARESPDFPGVQGARAYLFRRSGLQRRADALLAKLEGEARTGNPRARVNLGLAYAALGEVDAAFALLEAAEWDVPALVELRADPLLQPLRADPRYPALLEGILTLR